MRKGFTLIELLVVVLIMGILASVAMPQYFKSVEKARAAEAINALQAIAAAEQRYNMKTGNLTGNLWDLDIDLSMDQWDKQMVYFTLLYAGNFGYADGRLYGEAKMFRKDEAGAGLGQYEIIIRYPVNEGGSYTWDCEPKSAGCQSFLPK